MWTSEAAESRTGHLLLKTSESSTNGPTAILHRSDPGQKEMDLKEKIRVSKKEFNFCVSYTSPELMVDLIREKKL